MQRWVLDQLKSRFAVRVLSLNELLEDDVQPRDDRNSRLVVQLLLNDDHGSCFSRATLFDGELEATDDMKRMLSKLNEAELHGNATESTRSMFVTAAAKQQLEISSCLQEVFHVSMWQFVIVRFAFSRAINCPWLGGEYRLGGQDSPGANSSQAEMSRESDKSSSEVASFSAASQSRVVKPLSAAAAARRGGYGSMAKLAETTTAEGTMTLTKQDDSESRKKIDTTTTKAGPRPPAVQADKTDKWWCHGPSCGMDLGRGTKKKAQNWYRHKKNGVTGYYCPACYENWNFVLY